MVKRDSKLLKILYGGTTTIEDFQYDNLVAPPLFAFLTYQDIVNLNQIANDVRMSGDTDSKYMMIDTIMKSRGCKRLAGGTNRLVYYPIEYPNVVIKVAVDLQGCKDNPKEFFNQNYIKPYCCKVFEVSPCGTVGLFERVDRITSRYEFVSIADDVFDMIVNVLVGKYVLEDFGTNFMYNWGIRRGFGPVILDFPYIYELDGAKLYCNDKLDDGSICSGEIDYDAGFNYLQCKKCGKIYSARDLSKPQKSGGVFISAKKKGAINMDIEIRKGDEVVATRSYKDESQFFKNPRKVIRQRHAVINTLPVVEYVHAPKNKKISEIKKELREKDRNDVKETVKTEAAPTTQPKKKYNPLPIAIGTNDPHREEAVTPVEEMIPGIVVAEREEDPTIKVEVIEPVSVDPVKEEVPETVEEAAPSAEPIVREKVEEEPAVSEEEMPAPLYYVGKYDTELDLSDGTDDLEAAKGKVTDTALGTKGYAVFDRKGNIVYDPNMELRSMKYVVGPEEEAMKDIDEDTFYCTRMNNIKQARKLCNANRKLNVYYVSTKELAYQPKQFVTNNDPTVWSDSEGTGGIPVKVPEEIIKNVQEAVSFADDQEETPTTTEQTVAKPKQELKASMSRNRRRK